MAAQWISFRAVMAGLTAVVLLTAGVAPADTWLSIDLSGAVTLDHTAIPSAATLTVNRSDLTGLRVTADTLGLSLRTDENKLGQFVELSWPQAQVYGEIGTPALPALRRLIIAPAGAAVTVSAELGGAVTVGGSTLGQALLALPVQPPIEKIPGAREHTVLQFNPDAYKLDADLPAGRVVVQELGLVRGQRLCLLEIRPFGECRNGGDSRNQPVQREDSRPDRRIPLAVGQPLLIR